jgi:adenosylmethionine-8-amino-7-oxononanoate aminotransferase
MEMVRARGVVARVEGFIICVAPLFNISHEDRNIVIDALDQTLGKIDPSIRLKVRGEG